MKNYSGKNYAKQCTYFSNDELTIFLVRYKKLIAAAKL